MGPLALMARAMGALAIVGAALTAAPAVAAPDCTGLPKHARLSVVDAANVIGPQDEAWLNADLMVHHFAGHEAIVAATVTDLGGDDVSSYAMRLFDCWGVGDPQTDNGVLILVAMRERRVRIELGAGLDGRLTDGQLEAAIDTMVTPLRSGNVAAALRSAAGTVVRDLGGELPDTKNGVGTVPSMISPDDTSDDVPDGPPGVPFADGPVPPAFGPFDERDMPGAGFGVFFPLAFVGMVIVIIARAVTRAASSFGGSSYGESSWRGGFPRQAGPWGPPSMLHQGSWHDTSSGSSFGDSSSSSMGSGSAGGGSSFGGGSSGGGGASGSW